MAEQPQPPIAMSYGVGKLAERTMMLHGELNKGTPLFQQIVEDTLTFTVEYLSNTLVLGLKEKPWSLDEIEDGTFRIVMDFIQDAALRINIWALRSIDISRIQDEIDGRDDVLVRYLYWLIGKLVSCYDVPALVDAASCLMTATSHFGQSDTNTPGWVNPPEAISMLNENYWIMPVAFLTQINQLSLVCLLEEALDSLPIPKLQRPVPLPPRRR